MAQKPAGDGNSGTQETAVQETAIHLLVRGHVQGVGFRYFVKQSADAHAIAGWVRNLRDGRVEAVLIGAAHAVQAVLDAVERGPSSARVDEVVTRAPLDDELARARRPLEVMRSL